MLPIISILLFIIIIFYELGKIGHNMYVEKRGDA